MTCRRMKSEAFINQILTSFLPSCQEVQLNDPVDMYSNFANYFMYSYAGGIFIRSQDKSC